MHGPWEIIELAFCQTSRMCVFLNISVLQGGVVSTSPNPQSGGPLLVGCPRLLIQFIRSYPPYRGVVYHFCQTQNFIQQPALKVNSICEGNYRGLSMWLSTQQIDY